MCKRARSRRSARWWRSFRAAVRRLPTKLQLRSPPRKRGPRAKELDPRCRGRLSGAAPTCQAANGALPRSPHARRNYGPARLAGGTVVTPLARRLAGEAGIDLVERQRLRPARPHRGGRLESARSAKAPAPAQPRPSRPIALTADSRSAGAGAVRGCARNSARRYRGQGVGRRACSLWHWSRQTSDPIGKSRLVLVGAGVCP